MAGAVAQGTAASQPFVASDVQERRRKVDVRGGQGEGGVMGGRGATRTPLSNIPCKIDDVSNYDRAEDEGRAGSVVREQIGQEMLSNLNTDREKIQRARERLRETDANLGKSSRILTGMLRSGLAAGNSFSLICGLWAI
ncbi:hypothetical protein CRUP_007972 [Coryphaenoides rupestris]|nr:hypothetical protein CRUP_007972 [Coryphaenoides rupestris]